ncbi:MAG: response regulator [Chitinophagales bacterium]
MDAKKWTNILLIEDNPADARLVEIYLNESVMLAPRITKVTELRKGLLMLEENDFDIVLLDLTLPDSSGFETVMTLLREFPAQTVIVMTGLEDDSVAIRSVKAGAQDFIVKGQFDSNLLSRTISYAIERHELQLKLENYAKAIKQNEERLLEAQKMARMGNFELDIVNNQMYWSEEVFRILGFKENAFDPTLNDYTKYIDPADLENVQKAIRRSMEKGAEYRIDYKVVLPGDQVKRVANQGHIQLSKRTNGLCLIGTIQDITNLSGAQGRDLTRDALKNVLSDALHEAEKLQDNATLKEKIRTGLELLEGNVR